MPRSAVDAMHRTSLWNDGDLERRFIYVAREIPELAEKLALLPVCLTWALAAAQVLEATLAAKDARHREQLAAVVAENRALKAEVRQLRAGRAAAASCLPLLPGSSVGPARQPPSAVRLLPPPCAISCSGWCSPCLCFGSFCHLLAAANRHQEGIQVRRATQRCCGGRLHHGSL